MKTNLSCCLGLIDNGQYKSTNILLVCMYLRWFARWHKANAEPYYEMPLLVTRLMSIVHFWVGAHSLPIEQGRSERQRCEDTCADAPSVPPMLSATSVILSVFTLISGPLATAFRASPGLP